MEKSKAELFLNGTTVYSVDKVNEDGKFLSYHALFRDKNIATASAAQERSDYVKVRQLSVYEDGEGYIYEVKALGRLTDFNAKTLDDLKAKILSKLTPEEQILLGLNPLP